MYDKLTVMPEPGSPLESLMLIVWRMRQDLRVQEVRAVTTAIVQASSENADKPIQEAWKAYIAEMFPFQRGLLKSQDQRAIEYLKSEVAKGPLTVTPLEKITRGKSKLRRQQIKTESKRQR
jgi:hypothetical protein